MIELQPIRLKETDSDRFNYKLTRWIDQQNTLFVLLSWDQPFLWVETGVIFRLKKICIVNELFFAFINLGILHSGIICLNILCIQLLHVPSFFKCQKYKCTKLKLWKALQICWLNSKKTFPTGHTTHYYSTTYVHICI